MRNGETMRLSSSERNLLRQAARDAFEPEVALRLFGSRLDDARKGGDIDLLLETRMVDAAQIAKAQVRFLSRVYTLMVEQKIDLLIDFPARQQRPPIFEIARSQGVVL